jgi:UDP-glucose 4-epimerase
MNQISVIGATSPVGVHLVPKLVSDGYTVAASFRSFDLLPVDWNDDAAITSVKLDLREEGDSEAFAAETVVWLAHLDAGRENIRETQANLNAFENFLSKVDRSRTRRIVFVSSGGSVYGPQDVIPIKEDQERHPLSSYGRAKMALEDRLLDFGGSTDVEVAILRPGNIYGFESPHRFSKGVTGAFLRALDSSGPFTLIHGGETKRDFIHIDDICDAILLAVKSNGKRIVWNVSTGIGHRTMDVLELILKATGKSMPELIHRENYEADVLTSVLSPGRMRGEANWEAKIDLETGISKTADAWQNTDATKIKTAHLASISE